MPENYYKERANAIDRLLRELTIQRIIAVESINFFKESFDNQGFTDNTLIPWKKTKSGKSNTFGKTSKGILIESGELKDSFDYELQGLNIKIFNSADYAKTHNEGLTIDHPGGTAFYKKKGETDATFVSNKKANELQALKGLKLPRTKAHKIPIPKRKFMGTSSVLNERLGKKIIKIVLKILRDG